MWRFSLVTTRWDEQNLLLCWMSAQRHFFLASSCRVHLQVARSVVKNTNPKTGPAIYKCDDFVKSFLEYGNHHLQQLLCPHSQPLYCEILHKYQSILTLQAARPRAIGTIWEKLNFSMEIIQFYLLQFPQFKSLQVF